MADRFNPLPTMGDFCCLLIIFTNSLDVDSVGPDLYPDCLTLIVFLK